MKVTTLLLPSISVFKIASYFSMFFSLVALFQFYKISYLLTANRLASFISLYIIALSFTWWRQSEIVEVYTFNMTIFAYILRKSLEGNVSKNYYIISIILGLSFLVHIKNVLLIPAILFLIFIHTSSIWQVLKCFSLMMLGLVILWAITFFSHLNSYQSIFYEDSGVLNKVFHNIGYYLKSLLKHLFYLFYNFHFWIVISAYGIYMLAKTSFLTTTFLLLAGLPYFLFSMVFDVPDSYVYSLPFYFVIGIFIAIGIDSLGKKIKTNMLLILLFFSLANPIIYYTAYKLAAHTEKLAEMDKAKQYKGGLKYLMWPGMRGNVSLLELTHTLKKTNEKPTYFDEMKWNYDIAVNYLNWKEKAAHYQSDAKCNF